MVQFSAMNQKIVILYYKYTPLPRPQNFLIQQRAVCSELGLKGRILIAPEGINGTLDGTPENIQKYIDYMNAHEHFSGISYKKSVSTSDCFPKLSVKVRNEIVTAKLGDRDVNPWELTGEYLSAEELHQWYETNRDFVLVDMRNDYEQAVGTFDKAVPSGLRDFKDLAKVPENLSSLKDRTVVTVCTGGVRCEKASGYLKSQGFKNVYQLKDGIVTYMEKFPNQHFKGKLYVFDQRVLMGFDTDSPDHVVVGKCEHCGGTSENYINCNYDDCHRHYISCPGCALATDGYCSPDCKSQDPKNVQQELVTNPELL